MVFDCFKLACFEFEVGLLLMLLTGGYIKRDLRKEWEKIDNAEDAGAPNYYNNFQVFVTQRYQFGDMAFGSFIIINFTKKSDKNKNHKKLN